ncbi:MAG: sugar transferase [Anaerolineae bacterium]|nr:sugar transferase [Anaerolineae bacterium]
MSTLNYTLTQARSTPLVSRKRQRQIFLLVLGIGDVVALTAAFLLAYAFRFLLNIEVFEAVTPPLNLYARLFVVLIPAWIFLFHLFHLYDFHYLLGGTHEYARVFNASTLGMMVLIILLFFTRSVVARGWIVLFWLFSIIVVGAWRFVARRMAYAARRRGYLRVPTLIVGADEEGRAIANQLREAQTCGADLIGFVDDRLPVGEYVCDTPVLGSVSQLPHLVAQNNVEEVILSTSALTRPQVLQIYETLGSSSSVEVRLSPGLFEILTTGARVKEWGYVPLVSINKVRLSDLETFLKTLMDYTLTIVGLVCIAPILLLIAIAVKWSSPGPILYRRRVLGRGGREFDAFKFRTMYVNGDEILARYPELQAELQANHKLKNDPRVTPIGHFLRKYSLDELPQLFNVLLGQMSLVGPRMICPAEGAKYGKWKMNLLTVKPGITGLWQISGRSDVSYEERIRLDMHYIRNYSIWLDLMILFRTIPAVLRGRGAY